MLKSYYYELEIRCGSFTTDSDEKAIATAKKAAERWHQKLLVVYYELSKDKMRVIYESGDGSSTVRAANS